MPSKFSRRLGRRLTLTSKRGNSDYYKGYGARTEGSHTSKGESVRERRGASALDGSSSGSHLRGLL